MHAWMMALRAYATNPTKLHHMDRFPRVWGSPVSAGREIEANATLSRYVCLCHASIIPVRVCAASPHPPRCERSDGSHGCGARCCRGNERTDTFLRPVHGFKDYAGSDDFRVGGSAGPESRLRAFLNPCYPCGFITKDDLTTAR